MKPLPEPLPALIGLKTGPYRREMRKWRRVNKRVPWAQFLHDAVAGHYGKPSPKEDAA